MFQRDVATRYIHQSFLVNGGCHRINFFNATCRLDKRAPHVFTACGQWWSYTLLYIGLPLYRTDASITCGLLVFARHTHCTADPTLVLSLVSEGRNFHWLLIAWFLVFWLVQNYVWVRIKTLLLSIDISHVKLFGTLCIMYNVYNVLVHTKPPILCYSF